MLAVLELLVFWTVCLEIFGAGAGALDTLALTCAKWAISNCDTELVLSPELLEQVQRELACDATLDTELALVRQCLSEPKSLAKVSDFRHL